MGGATGRLKGPDLREGVRLDALPEGEPFTGHADGEAVILVRRRNEVSAVGGTCSHYGGPLGDGLVVGNTVRCPWHHACFSLKTGEALGAPALNPVPVWGVEVEDGVVRVAGKRRDDPLEPAGRRPAVPRETVVVVGAGAAGSAAAEQLRREGHAGRIHVVDPDVDAPYDRPNLSKDYLAGSAPEEWLPLRPEGFYEGREIDRIVARVEAVDATRRTLRLSDGGSLEWDALLLATGSSPIGLGVPGADLPHVHTLRSLRDCRALMAAAAEASRVVVAGASFIGMEAAAALRSRGLDVTVVAPEQVPFERTLGPDVGVRIWRAHEAAGVEFRLGQVVAAVDEDAAVLDDGSRLPADLVVVGIGVRPDTRLAEAAGAAVDDGVLVDAFLETSVPGVYAAGDIARWPAPVPGGRLRVEHWVHAQRMGQAAARSIAGRPEPFTDVPFFWTSHFDLAVGYTGYAVAGASTLVDEGDGGALTVRYARDGQVYAKATIGRDLEALRFEVELEGRARSAVSTSAGVTP